MKRREHIRRGYVAFTGKTLSDGQVDGYNRIQDDINAFVDSGRAAPEWLVDWSFRYFRDAASN
jgi:hypothetical protein